jgi:cyclic-di-AMP phosphodiesterase PgpH
LELNENQNLNSKKPKNNNAPFEMITRITGIFRLPSFREGFLIVFCFSLLITLLQFNLSPHTYDVKVGQASKVEIITPKDVTDHEATRLAQKDAVDRALEIGMQDPDNYQIDEQVSQMISFKLNRFFESIDLERKKYNTESPKILTPETLQIGNFKKFFYLTPSLNLLKKIVLLPVDDYQELKEKTHQIIADIERHQRIDTKGVVTARLFIPQKVEERKVSSEIIPVVSGLLEVVIQPNLIIDAAKIKKIENRVRAEVPEVVHHAGELLIAKNQVITENDLKMLQDLHLIVTQANRIQVFLSLSCFILLLIGLGWLYIWQFHTSLLKQERLLYLLLLLVVLVVGLVKVLSLTENTSLPYLAPISFGSMLMTILIDPELALAMTIILSLLGGIIVDYSLALTIFYFVSGVIPVLALLKFGRQRDLVRCGFILMVVNAVTVTLINLLFHTTFDYQAVILAITNGFLSAVLAIGSLPFLEHIFRITSPIRLLELSNPGHPLLRRLQIEAPGTYHHSIMVGNLAEAAAEGIGADTLWVRVGSYYHDIGKIKRPYFFVENLFTQDNPHEKLNPTLSTLIITYHVKEGAEIAREHGLPEKLIQIIEQHHGTDLVRYFYKRASENVQVEKEMLLEEDFRYEGPKPQTKEAALVMLADSVEAAVKSLSKPTPAKVEALVQRIIRERLDDGQFDECNLTLKDLNNVKNSFIKVLGGMFHNRIEYPENVLQEIERKKTNGDNGK